MYLVKWKKEGLVGNTRNNHFSRSMLMFKMLVIIQNKDNTFTPSCC